MRTTCFMALRRSVTHVDGVEVGRRRDRDGGGAVADDNRAGLLGVRAALLVALNRDPVRARSDRLVVVVEAVPDEVVLSSRPGGARDGSEWLEVAVKSAPQRGEVR